MKKTSIITKDFQKLHAIPPTFLNNQISILQINILKVQYNAECPGGDDFVIGIAIPLY